MPKPAENANEAQVIRGEFFTDGSTYIFRLAGLPVSGTGATPQAAYDDMLRAQAASGDLPRQLRLIAREQQGEQVRATLVRTSLFGLIALTLVGGLAAGLVALAPRVAADMTQATISAMHGGVTPETRAELSTLLQGAEAPAAQKTEAGGAQ